MTWWSSRSRLPAEIVGALELAAGERVLASASLATGSHLVATDRALWLPAGQGFYRIGWESVDRATWDRDSEQLTVIESTPLGQRPRPHVLRLVAAGRLLDVVRERVNAAVVITRFVRVNGERGVRVIARRRPGTDALIWTVSVDSGIDLNEPRVKAIVDAALAEARSDVGR